MLPTTNTLNLKLNTFRRRGDELGWLIPLEGNRDVPFEIKRIYYIYGTRSGVRRGMHAHRNLRQMAICISGSCRFIMDDGRNKKEFVLNRLDVGLMIEPMVWHEMEDFSDDCVLLVLASDVYDESDYIRNYSDFIAAASDNSLYK